MRSLKTWTLYRIGAALAVSLFATAQSGGAMTQDVDKTYISKAHKFKINVIADGMQNPWSLAFLPDGGMLVTERPGRLRLIAQGKLQQQPLAGVPQVVARGQGGLLDVALHPKFSENKLVYLTYSGAGEGGVNTEVARAAYNNGRLENLQVIFKSQPKTSGNNHYGSKLLFHPDGTLFVTLGDRYTFMKEAQSTANHLGTIVRLNDDGSVPEGNPFAGNQRAKPEIFSYGHRNVQGIALRPGTQTVWAHEHGPQGGDELNILKPGANYGWPAITYGVDYSGAIISDKKEAPGMEQPVVYWVPSIAPSGMTFYSGDLFPQWKGDIFIGALTRTHLRRVKLNGDKVVEQEELLKELGERIRDVRQGPDGLIYLLTDDPSDGKLLRLEPVN
jgi:glucose/arabinose dehydrogenase